MSTPAPQPGQASSSSSRASSATAQAAQQSQAQGQAAQARAAAQGQVARSAAEAQAAGRVPANQPANAPAQSKPPIRRSTPRLLRLARNLAAGAALLTGVVATGTFSADGLNATPDVVAHEWVAAERAGVEAAHADALAAQRMVAGEDKTARADFDAAVSSVGTDLAAMGDARGSAEGTAAESWSTFVVSAERAVAKASAPTYAAASKAAEQTVAATDTVAQNRADALRSGSRSTLTAIVGAAATIVLLLLMVWLALRTHRMVNVPLLLATLITAGLTYVSLDPAAMPVDFDSAVADTTTVAQELQHLYTDRQDVLAAELTGAAQPADVQDAAKDTASFQAREADLRASLDSHLAATGTDVGRPAVLTSGAALLLGLLAAWLAWAGLTQRLKDYR